MSKSINYIGSQALTCCWTYSMQETEPWKNTHLLWWGRPFPRVFRGFFRTNFWKLGHPLRGGTAIAVSGVAQQTLKRCPKWHSPIGSMPFHRTQKTLDFQGHPSPALVHPSPAPLYTLLPPGQHLLLLRWENLKCWLYLMCIIHVSGCVVDEKVGE
jgi:hypothetical protein